MNEENTDLAASLEELFTALDAMELKPATIFGSDREKERYESLLMFGFRKLEAANYHLTNVRRLLTEAVAQSKASEALLRTHFEGQLFDVGRRTEARLNTQM